VQSDLQELKGENIETISVFLPARGVEKGEKPCPPSRLLKTGYLMVKWRSPVSGNLARDVLPKCTATYC